MSFHEHSYYSNGKKRTQVCKTAPLYDHGTLVGAFQIQEDLFHFKDMGKENSLVQYEVVYQHRAASEETAFSSLVGRSGVFAECKDLAKCVAKTGSSVMLVGSTGSGKEVFARAIHDSSSRRKGPFLALNCAAIPEGLFEAILFGTTKSVYTGATEKAGLFAQADGGTIFLALLIYAYLAGHTLFINELGLQSLGEFLNSGVKRTLMLGPVSGDPWPGNWTINFYIANAAYAPLIGVFLAKLGRGRTIRQFIAVNLGVCSVFNIICFNIFGGSAIWQQLHGLLYRIGQGSAR